MNDDRLYDVVRTYRYLRLALVLLAVLLAVAVTWQSVAAGCMQGSISAYYYTPVRAVFVGSLCAVGACLIVYRGATTTEDVLLNVAGFLAFVVAFVPTVVDRRCAASNVPSPGELEAAIRNNVWALVVTAAIAILVALVLDPGMRPGSRADRLGTRGTAALAVTALGLLAGVVFFAFWPAEFARWGHGLAALAFIGCIVAVVVVNALRARRYRFRYAVLALTMLGYGVGTWLLGQTGMLDRWLLWLEAGLTVLFAAYWVMQTVELWNVATPKDALTPS